MTLPQTILKIVEANVLGLRLMVSLSVSCSFFASGSWATSMNVSALATIPF